MFKSFCRHRADNDHHPIAEVMADANLIMWSSHYIAGVAVRWQRIYRRDRWIRGLIGCWLAQLAAAVDLSVGRLPFASGHCHSTTTDCSLTFVLPTAISDPLAERAAIVSRAQLYFSCSNLVTKIDIAVIRYFVATTTSGFSACSLIGL